MSLRLVCFDFEAIALGNYKGDLKGINRIQTQPLPKQRIIRLNIARGNLELKRRNDEFSYVRLRYHYFVRHSSCSLSRIMRFALRHVVSRVSRCHRRDSPNFLTVKR